MTGAGLGYPGPPPDLDQVVICACGQAGFPSRRFQLLRHFATAVYLVEDVPVVVRVAYGPGDVERSRKAVTITRWLTAKGLPVTEPVVVPSGVSQPLVMRGDREIAVTFWHYYQPPSPPPADDCEVLALMARSLHAITSRPPILLPDYRPLRSLQGAVDDGRRVGVVDPGVLGWIDHQIQLLREEYSGLSFPLGAGLIHGDLHLGNLLPVADASVVLGDWDSVCIGPREIDLIPTFSEIRFGFAEETLTRFVNAYGYDLRGWSGFTVLRAIRDLSTLTALIRLAPTHHVAAGELRHRLDTLQRNDTTALWTPQ